MSVAGTTIVALSGDEGYDSDQPRNVSRVAIRVTPPVESALTGLASTVEDELEIAATIAPDGFAQSDLSPLAAAWLGGISRRAPLGSLSGGELVKVAVMSAALRGPDEIFVGSAFEQLDQRSRSLGFDLLARIAASGRTKVTFCDHMEPFALRERFPNVVIRASEVSSTSFIGPLTELALRLRLSPESQRGVQIRNLSFKYPSSKSYVFRNASIDLEPGRIHLLNGPNGSGKSTLLRLLAGSLVPVGGVIKVAGKRFGPQRSAFRFAAFAMQNPDFRWLRVKIADELADVQRRRALSDDVAGLLQALRDRYRLRFTLDSDPLELDFSTKKLLMLLLTFLEMKPWVILDEPTWGLDTRHAADVATAIRILSGRGFGIAIATHDLRLRQMLDRCHDVDFQAGQITAIR